ARSLHGRERSASLLILNSRGNVRCCPGRPGEWAADESPSTRSGSMPLVMIIQRVSRCQIVRGNKTLPGRTVVTLFCIDMYPETSLPAFFRYALDYNPSGVYIAEASRMLCWITKKTAVHDVPSA